jgi:hypothetical protein
VATLEPAAFIAQAKVDDALIKAEYDKSPDSIGRRNKSRLSTSS